MEFSQICDRVDIDPEIGPMDISGLPGTWINSNPDSNGIARLVISEADGKVSSQVYAIGPEGLIDWGAAELAVWAGFVAAWETIERTIQRGVWDARGYGPMTTFVLTNGGHWERIVGFGGWN